MIPQESIKHFCDQCCDIRHLYKEYMFLYESDNQKRLDLIDKTARDFFHELQRILIDYIFLNICKITDNASFGKNDNLTIKYILNNIDEETANKFELNKLSDEIHKFREKIVSARNKIIVHSDFETIAYNKTLGTFSISDNDDFWENLQKFVNAIHTHYFKEPLDFDKIVDCTSNAKYLILALKKAAYFDKHFKDVLHCELLEENQFEFKDA
ncbi:MAG: AbiU2 domain-containing protein [Planctomycetota bacterium]|jgi:hypothetical protein